MIKYLCYSTGIHRIYYIPVRYPISLSIRSYPCTPVFIRPDLWQFFSDFDDSFCFVFATRHSKCSVRLVYIGVVLQNINDFGKNVQKTSCSPREHAKSRCWDITKQSLTPLPTTWHVNTTTTLCFVINSMVLQEASIHAQEHATRKTAVSGLHSLCTSAANRTISTGGRTNQVMIFQERFREGNHGQSRRWFFRCHHVGPMLFW